MSACMRTHDKKKLNILFLLKGKVYCIETQVVI